MPLCGVGKRCRTRTEQRLQLVGAQCFERWHAGDQQGGNGDQTAAAGNGIDEARHEGGEEQEGEEMEGDFEHVQAFKR